MGTLVLIVDHANKKYLNCYKLGVVHGLPMDIINSSRDPAYAFSRFVCKNLTGDFDEEWLKQFCTFTFDRLKFPIAVIDDAAHDEEYHRVKEEYECVGDRCDPQIIGIK